MRLLAPVPPPSPNPSPIPPKQSLQSHTNSPAINFRYKLPLAMSLNGLHDVLSSIAGPSVHVVLQEITDSISGLPASSAVCDFGGMLTLGDAFRKDFRISGDGTTQAFPTHQFAAKMAFLHVFNDTLGSTYRPRRKQVTVTTSRNGIKQQPSKGRLAYLVACEMKKYMNECNLRRKPFPYTLDDIVLRRIDLESRGTFRPRLFIHVRGARSMRSTSAATF